MVKVDLIQVLRLTSTNDPGLRAFNSTNDRGYHEQIVDVDIN